MDDLQANVIGAGSTSNLPDGSNTLILLGAALVGFAAFRRRFVR